MVLRPLKDPAEHGINMLCPDGKRRLCHPIIAEYIADYQEQFLLGCITSGSCPKCTIPRYRSIQVSEPKSTSLSSNNPISIDGKRKRGMEPKKKPGKAGKSDQNSKRMTHPDSGNECITYERRTEEEGLRLRERYDAKELNRYGLKPESPFTLLHEYSDIHDILAPDLLHQASKMFYDNVYCWIMKILALHHSSMSYSKLEGEIDARFSQLPPYPGLRHFRAGLTPTQRWTGNEYKAMAKVFLGLIRDLLPRSVIQLVRSYLDIIRLAHYVSHSETTRIYLINAVNEYISLRNDPQGPLVRYSIIPERWYSAKQHYFQHYGEWIKEKGPLPFCSTDRTEALHKLHKEDYKRSNKGAHFHEFLLRNETRKFAVTWYESLLSAKYNFETPRSSVPNDVEAPDPSDVEDPDTSGSFLLENSESMVRFGGERWKGERTIEYAGVLCGHPDDLVRETKLALRWIRKNRQPQSSRLRLDDWEENEMIVIRGYTQLSVLYPTVHDPRKRISEIIRSTEKHYYGKDREWQKSRYDTVLIRYESTEGVHSMSNRRVARILLLFSFECPITEETLKFAFVQLLALVGGSWDPESEMFKVRKDKYAVIEVGTIERGVHLIPCFKGFDTKMASRTSEPSLDIYTEFWMNNYSDEHMYNTIYANSQRWNA